MLSGQRISLTKRSLKHNHVEIRGPEITYFYVVVL